MTDLNTAETDLNPRRALILRQAIETFAESGFRNTDVQVIADRAAVGKGTVYRYFGSKEELFWAATYEVLVLLQEYMFADIDDIDDPLEALRALGRAHANFFQQNPSFLEIFVLHRAEFRGTVPPLHKEYHEQMIGRIVRLVEQGIARGQVRPADPRGIVISLGAVLFGTIMFACHVADQYSLTELSELSVQSFLRGIRAD